MLFGKVKKMIEDGETQIKLDLSNNYKDSAYKSFVEFEQLVISLKEQGNVNDKDYAKLEGKINDYKVIFRKYMK